MKPSKRKREPAHAEAATAQQPLVMLPASCTLREAHELKAVLLRWVATPQPVTLDVSAVQRIDSAALQVLCAFVRDRHARNLSCSWEGNAAVLSEAVDLLGLRAAIGLPAAMT